MAKYSKNAKLNAVLNDIEEQIKLICDTEEESREEVDLYKKEYPKELDYNIFQHGNLIIFTWDIRKMYETAGYKSVARWNDNKVIEMYKHQIRYVVDNMNW